jgi:hypothetical protein
VKGDLAEAEQMTVFQDDKVYLTISVGQELEHSFVGSISPESLTRKQL